MKKVRRHKTGLKNQLPQATLHGYIHDIRYNERYIRDISKKIRANLRFKIEQGEYIGNAPFGYVKSVNEKNKLVIDSRNAPVVKEIFSLYRKGYGYAAIANMLNQKGYPSPSSKNSEIPITPWNQVAVQRILCNRVYIGDTVQGVSEKISFKNKKTRRLPFDKWIITTNTHEPIISNEDFDEVQKLRAKKRSNQGYNRNVTHLLSNLVYCGKCGKAMYVRVRKDRPVGYICSSYSKKGCEACSSHYVTEESIIDIVTKELLELLSNNELIDNLNMNYNSEFVEKERLLHSIKRFEQQIIQRQKQQDILYNDRLEERISEQLFFRMNQNLETRISTIRQEVEKLKEEETKQLDKEQLIKNFVTRIKTQGITRNIIELMVNKITVFDSKDVLPETDATLEDTENGCIVIEYNYNNWKQQTDRK
ncbi:recombinase family protein [Ruminiclostridium papyrosolvens]|uniref:recombinase family protein n=1 Tax=Ruminiclostridium papyrosolvens TaxID=29362 RepID=UPI0009DB894F|nr:recombinase family protein [Ruminiclostridium papyrosolvens]